MKRSIWLSRSAGMAALVLAVAVAGIASAQDRVGSSKQARGGGGLTVNSLDTGLTATDLADAIAGEGVTVSNVSYTGAQISAGTFSNGGGIIGLESGVVLGSGDVNDAVGPNDVTDVSTTLSTPGDADLDAAFNPFVTQDATVLEFDIVPSADTVFIQYIFSSDEYNEYVNSNFNDVFAFFINGANCATVNSDPVSINTINNGNPFGSVPNSNPEFFRNNEGGAINTEMDGLTTILTCESAVNAGVANTVKLAIADVGDSAFDSNVFIQANGVTTVQPPPPPGAFQPVAVPLLDRFGLALLVLLMATLGVFAVVRRVN